MSVLDKNVIDGVAVDDNNKLILLLSDHLNWKDEYWHLINLQEKINHYITYIETKQYKKIYPNYEIKDVVIDIHLMHFVTSKCFEFINSVNATLSEATNNGELINIIVILKNQK